MDGKKKSLPYRRRKTYPIRVSSEFMRVIQMVRAEYLIKGQKPPTTEQITRKIASIIKKDDLYTILTR